MKTQAEDGLPLVFLALYEKYTCLHFTELLSTIEKKQMFRLRNLKKKMLEFKAFGTVHPAKYFSLAQCKNDLSISLRNEWNYRSN